MELKVWVEGIQRIVCGVTETTTCQDVVYALAHATAQSGRFTLVERWRNNERFLAPFENPLTVLMKWGEYASDVQLILRRSNSDGNKPQQGPLNARSAYGIRPNGVQGPALDPLINNRSQEGTHNNGNSAAESHESPEVLKRNRDIRKSLTFSGLHGTTSDNNSEVQMENIAVVQPTLQTKVKDVHSRKAAFRTNESPTRVSSSEGFRNLTHKQYRESPPYRDPPGPDSSPIRTLPPYRDPPPPIVTNSAKLQALENQTSEGLGISKDEQSSATNMMKIKRSQEMQDTKGLMQSNRPQLSQPQNMVAVAYTQRYAELIRLVNKQRDTINAHQVDLTKLDAEIMYWENKNREHFNQMDFISQEINRIESTGRLIEEQLNELINTEDESEIVRQQEKTLKSEITLLRSKLANCETELLQCKNKIRLLMEEISMEQHSITRESEERLLMERKVMNEVERLQTELDQAKRSSDHSNQSADLLKQEVTNIESAIIEKKLQLERLVNEMKEANLQSLTVGCQEEQIKNLLEGVQKPGSTRKIIGSPRQLENAVPTSKNPHGVWV
ncbi:ras association domain-containing protein 8-like [Chelonus insularis]|uniref:ras association domain-containing protein 8-like n=1 Tax=Chelonus insularis TaxID=460826 RepID=UPI00158D2810|nr:ras association domain-containing protein 8-like [Chelonus insularis]XP_034949293.1 ras association domain-containing protein 8-like [Chelonus insularis]